MCLGCYWLPLRLRLLVLHLPGWRSHRLCLRRLFLLRQCLFRLRLGELRLLMLRLLHLRLGA